jgi:hypothetical protein
VGTLHKISLEIDKLLDAFATEETDRLAAQMPHRQITGCCDETFFPDKMLAVFMDAVSGFILAEQEEKQRDAETWKRVIEVSLKGLNVNLIQITGDEGRGLTGCAVTLLGVHKSSDLFHIHQDITKGLTCHLARSVRRAEGALQEATERKNKHLEALQRHAHNAKFSIDEPKTSACAKKLLEADKAEKACAKHLEKTQRNREEAVEARKVISAAYHPFDLITGQKQTPARLKLELQQAYNQLEVISKKAGSTENQKKRLLKSKGMIDAMVNNLIFFWTCVHQFICGLQLEPATATVFEDVLLPIEYLKLTKNRSACREDKERMTMAIAQLEDGLGQRAGPWSAMGQKEQERLRIKAQECAQLFQRSSSCVEGRNGVLSLRYHAFRGMSKRALRSSTVIHNFFIEREDGTTAAERFFGQEPRSLFEWILDRINWPVRPRNSYNVLPKSRVEAAA